MNRQQRRDFLKKAQRAGVSEDKAHTYVDIARYGSGTPSEPKSFSEDDKVMLNVDVIKNRKNYDKMTEAYKTFVESSKGKVFTAHVETKLKNCIELKEEPKWLFWSGDLLPVIDIVEGDEEK